MMTGFNNPIVGAGGALVYPSIHSPNFSAGPPITGWSIDKNGDAFFSGTFTGNNYEINSDGVFFYSGTPAADNLIASIADASGVDPYGNDYLAGTTGYAAVTGGFIAVQLALGVGTSAGINFWSASPHMSSGWSINGDITVNTSGQMTISTINNETLSVPEPLSVGGILAQLAGSNSSGSAPSPGQALSNGVASQLTDTTRDYMLYLLPAGAGNLTIQIGPTSATGRTIMGATAVVAGALYPVRVPAGWFVKWTGTGTVTLASQTVVGC